MMLELFFDKENNVILNPINQHPAGFGRSSSEYVKLEKGWKLQELAKAILDGLKSSNQYDNEQAKDKFWTRATGIKGFATFSKKYNCISVVYLHEKNCYMITANKRYKDGSYGIDNDEVETRVKTYEGFPSEETIANQVLEALKLV